MKIRGVDEYALISELGNPVKDIDFK